MEKIALIGSGNWGSTMAKIVGKKAQEKSNIDTTVNMWVFEEVLEGRKLTEIINTEHENVKYLPGIPLPHNVRAVPDLLEAIKGATILIFVVPHQFIEGLCNQMKGHVDPGAKAVSLIKGVNVKEGDEGGLGLISQMISETLDIDVSVLMGANIANEVAAERFCESTVGYNVKENGELFRDLFDTPYFRITAIQDVAGVELCGALKNVVAVAAGLVDGLDLGNNTKAAIIRIGLMEMKRFAIHFYGGVREETFFESCGVADVITTCLGGRNRRISEARVRTGKSFDDLEREMLNGQKLQGTTTAKEVHAILSRKGMTDEFPLFTRVYRICYEGLEPEHIVTDL